MFEAARFIRVESMRAFVSIVVLSLIVGMRAPAAAQSAARAACLGVNMFEPEPLGPLADEMFEVVGRYDAGVARDVAAMGDVLFYAAGPTVIAVDVSDPVQPAEIMRRSFGPPTGTSPAAIDVVDSLAYVGVGRTLYTLDEKSRNSRLCFRVVTCLVVGSLRD